MTDTLPGLEDDTPPAAPFIAELLTQALVDFDRSNIPTLEASRACKTNAERDALYAPYLRDLYSFLWHSSLAHVLIRVEESSPNLAAGIAHEVQQWLDAGDAYPEWVYDWAKSRGLDPETIVREAGEARTAWLAAEVER